MERKPSLIVNITLGFSMLIMGLIILFWLRELNLTCLASFRVVILPLAAITGLALEISFGSYIWHTYKVSLQSRMHTLFGKEGLWLLIISLILAAPVIYSCLSAGFFKAIIGGRPQIGQATLFIFLLCLISSSFSYLGTLTIYLLLARNINEA